MNSSITLAEIVAKTTHLPVMPAAAVAVMEETKKATCTARSVAACLQQDQALSSRMLRLSNSSFYGMSRRVSTIQDAVVVLGMRVVRNLAIVASTYPFLQKSLSGYGLAAESLWAHSFATGVAAQSIAEHTKKVDPSEAFVAGLLHNMGKLALNIWIENKIVPLIALCERESLSFDAIERKVLDWTVDKTFGCVLKNQSWTVLSYVETDSSEPSHAYFARSGNSINFGTMLAKPKAIPDVSDATKYRSFIEIRMDMTNPDPKVPAHRVDPSSFDFGVVVIQRASDPLRFLTKQKARDLKLLPADCE